MLIALSIITKVAVVLFTTGIFHSFVDIFDVSVYYRYAMQVLGGAIPYVDFSLEYPQLSLVVILVPLIFTVLTGDPSTYLVAHQVFMSIFDILTTLLVYLIALRVSDQRCAFISGVLSATAFSSAYFVLTKYDAFPTFLLMLSLFLFIYRKEICGYLSAVAGFLAKWFPGLAIPYFALHEYMSGRDPRTIGRHIIASAALLLIITLPFAVLNSSVFLATYTAHTGRTALAHSFCYYVDFALENVLGLSFFAQVSLLLMAVVQIFLLGYYYSAKNTSAEYLCAFLFFSTFAFVIFNKVFSPQYLLWITPFLAIFLARSYKEIALFYAIQAWVYLEFPILYRSIYINDGYFVGDSSPLASVPFLFFTIKFILLLAAFGMVWISLKHPDLRVVWTLIHHEKSM
ncbi:MAG: hypothetical protein PHP55_03495 [Methanoculleus sp.]|nr:hypothetical protein [Methanoculleus sp.]